MRSSLTAQLTSAALFALLLVCSISLSFQASGDEDHAHHSDDLLLLIQHKLSVARLQTEFSTLPIHQQTGNLNQQAKELEKALHRLQRYVAVPSGHYPNAELYQQSLENRAAMVKTYAELTQLYFQQIQQQIKNQPAAE